MATPSIARFTTAGLAPVPDALKPLHAGTLVALADRIVSAAQSIDPKTEDILRYDTLPGYLQARAKFLARAAVRGCHQSVMQDAELKARAAMAETLYGRSYGVLSGREQARVYHTVKATLAAYQRHLEGTSGELLPSERESLMVPGEERIGA